MGREIVDVTERTTKILVGQMGSGGKAIAEAISFAINQTAQITFKSEPPSGKYKIVNIYWDNDIQKVVIERLTEPE